MLGGMKAQGRTAVAAARLLADAREMEAAGCFALVLESVPARVSEHVTQALGIPTIGIGAGAGCDGQVLVWHDLLGLTKEPRPRFVKQYADLSTVIGDALREYVRDVRAGTFPQTQHTYPMSAEELEAFEARLG